MNGARKLRRACLRSRPSAIRRATLPMYCHQVRRKVFIQSDVTNNPYLFAANPGWHAFFDQDGGCRRKRPAAGVYDMIVAEKLQVQGFHYPIPGRR